MILVVRNDGAKSISLGQITASNFILRDAKGQDLKVYLENPRQKVTSLMYGEATILHLRVENANKAPGPFTFHARLRPLESDEGLELTISDISMTSRRMGTVIALFALTLAFLAILRFAGIRRVEKRRNGK